MTPSPTRGVLGMTFRTAAYRVVSGVAAAGITILTARSLGPSGRGAFVLAFTLATVSYLACMFGINTAARVHLVAKRPAVLPGDYVGLCAALVVLEVIVCTLLSMACLPLVGVDVSIGVHLVTGLLGGSFLAQYTLFDAVNAFGRTDIASGLDAVGSIAQVVFVLVLAELEVRHIGPYLAALTAANGIQVVLELLSLRWMKVPVRPRYRRDAWKLLLRSGLAGTTLSLAPLLTLRADRYIVGLFLNPNAVGIYSVAAAVPELLRVPAAALSNSFFYRIASGLAHPHDFARLRRSFILLSAVLSGLTFVAAPALVRLVFGERYLGAVGPLRVLLLAEIGVSVFQLDGFTLAGLNRIPQAALAAAAGLVVVTASDFALIPAFGINGAAWASVLGYSVMGGMAALLLRRQVAARG